MEQCIIGPNAALRYLKAYYAHIGYWQDVNPAYALAYVDKDEHIPYILEYAAALPQTRIVARIQHPLDGGFHLKPTGKDDHREYTASPKDYHDKYGALGRIDNIILNVFNEPNGFASEAELKTLNRWFVDYIKYATISKTKSVLFNWADRNPRMINGMMDGVYDDSLKLMAEHPNLFYMGMHFYGPDEVVAHLDAYVERCKFLEITPPKVIGTEFGLDKTNGKESGYKSRPEYRDGDKFARWEIEQVEGDLQPHIQSGVLVALLNFQEGNSGGWENFDTENDKAYKDEIKSAEKAGKLTARKITTRPFLKPVPKPEKARLPLRIYVQNTSINVRSGPGTEYQDCGDLVKDQPAVIFEPTQMATDGTKWSWVEYLSVSEKALGMKLGGWISMAALKFTVNPPTEEKSEQNGNSSVGIPTTTVPLESAPTPLPVTIPVFENASPTPLSVGNKGILDNPAFIEQLKIIRNALDAIIKLSEVKPVQAESVTT